MVSATQPNLYHIGSKRFGDCGICCAAMLTRKSYEEVVESVSLRTYGDIEYLDLPEMYAFFAKNDALVGTCGPPKGSLSGVDHLDVRIPLSYHALVTVPGTRKPFLHYVVWDGSRRKILDPNMHTPLHWDNYQIIEWNFFSKWERKEFVKFLPAQKRHDFETLSNGWWVCKHCGQYASTELGREKLELRQCLPHRKMQKTVHDVHNLLNGMYECGLCGSVWQEDDFDWEVVKREPCQPKLDEPTSKTNYTGTFANKNRPPKPTPPPPFPKK